MLNLIFKIQNLSDFSYFLLNIRKVLVNWKFFWSIFMRKISLIDYFCKGLPLYYWVSDDLPSHPTKGNPHEKILLPHHRSPAPQRLRRPIRTRQLCTSLWWNQRRRRKQPRPLKRAEQQALGSFKKCRAQNHLFLKYAWSTSCQQIKRSSETWFPSFQTTFSIRWKTESCATAIPTPNVERTRQMLRKQRRLKRQTCKLFRRSW